MTSEGGGFAVPCIRTPHLQTTGMRPSLTRDVVEIGASPHRDIAILGLVRGTDEHTVGVFAILPQLLLSKASCRPHLARPSLALPSLPDSVAICSISVPML